LNSNPVWNRLHAIVEMLIFIGFLIGLIPFLYGWAGTWVIPLTVVSAVLAFVLRNGLLPFALANFVMSLLSFLPLIGYVPRIIGLVIALISIAILSRRSR
jgi:hypothetical protein